MYLIDYNSYRSVKSFNRRTRFLVMHYTALNFQASITALTGNSVSAHYLVPDPTDKTYQAAGFKDVRIFNLVDENERAWHAGVSFWAGRSNLNDTAIGIEIVNEAGYANGKMIFPPFNDKQIDAVKELALNIIQRYPDMLPTNIVAHSDIAPGRKSDPGAAFPWKKLYNAGIGAWYEEEIKQQYMAQFKNKMPEKAEIVTKLKRYGYDVSQATNNNDYTKLIRAFQLHFRQSNYDGNIDIETVAILYALVAKYFP
ncbi:N-acetylmuramoyl-L-alanine amidase [Arsenophonus nasoniae]|uniref:N-acetylmuramoyl-L-alanine amidase n=1 Tax=Arsenophonus nasoniae TaxID=638 RepID=D2TYW7_9GAMM|nr:N-acetylmuramoyl-L-alanine amidase [Arsenophonus nasoniae]QBY43872.1 N-acetylmuramoyl-L-alanine amidase AmiD [Arsenophonus nasoniae]WGL96628.1 N-acetylmuramoyl-L-alanine amidase [Arsenophonus nasoniae]WGM00275.1 N-acetylmuramoyl-L-alanine amidase [Arsenophonus nasoniae]WGM04210.1 N-acetylmuramoyl-L-alanine amidase [Arsenophonus nasoniae]WGM09313.1 N-acetylmuramoyl-L-alanine amidase [Arsenophonus nasoniae]